MIIWASGNRVGPYVLVSQIGTGGMGEVWKARDTRLDRVVAIKRLKGEYNKRFEQEARAIAALNHPHICQLYDIGPDYLVMEYVDGKPLPSPIAAEEARRLAIQIASALEEAHRRGVIHRDLKPANILVTESGTAKLLDFGLARLAASSDSAVTLDTIQGTLTGTPAYLAPEQAEGKPLDHRCDIFSFGAILYEMLSGRPAFEGNSLAQILSAVLRDDPRPLRAPPALERIVMRCLAKQPAERFQTISEVRAALENLSQKPTDLVRSIAVLPFANIGDDKENEYFSDGLAEEIINILANIGGLKVTARTSSFAFRGREQDIRKVAEALNVRSIVQGSVRRAGYRIRVTAQLIDADDGCHLWSERYDREIADVFAMQDEIAEAIAAALQVKLSVGSARPPRYTPNIPAYETFLKAVYHGARLTPDSLERQREYLQQAIKFDPQFALAHTALGNHSFVLACGALQPAHEAMPAARAAAEKALDIDPSLPEAHCLLGTVAAVYDYDWKEAARRFSLAMARDPVPLHIRGTYGFWYLMPAGRLQDAVEQSARTLQNDPLSFLGRTNLGFCLLAAGTGADACVEFRKALEIEANFWFAVLGLGITYALEGMVEQALAFAERAYSLAPWFPDTIGLLASMLRRTAHEKRAEDLLEKLGSGEAYGAPRGLTIFHSLCGETDKAAYWTQKAIEQRDPWVPLFMRSPLRKALPSSDRWPSLVEAVHLPEGA